MMSLFISLIYKKRRETITFITSVFGQNMRRISLSSTSSDDRRIARRKRIWKGLGIGLVLLVVLTASLLIGLRSKKSDSPGPKSTCTPVQEDLKRFDCHPDRPISQKSCLDRGCCFLPASDLKVDDYDLINSSYLGVPSCFFPLHYKGYRRKDKKTSGNKISATFERVTPSGFPKDVQKIALEVTPIDDNRLRIQVFIFYAHKKKKSIISLSLNIYRDPLTSVFEF